MTYRKGGAEGWAPKTVGDKKVGRRKATNGGPGEGLEGGGERELVDR